MKHWTDIRSIAELKTFQSDFRALSDVEKDVITTEMLFEIAKFKMKESAESIKARQVEKSAVLSAVRTRRPYRPRR